jgi:uncharacterized protein
MHIIDRRRDPGGKSLANRQRFIRRARAQVRRAVREASANRSIKDVDKGGDIVVPADGVREPTLRRGSHGGRREYVLPGNKKYIQGDTIPRPDEDGGGGGASADGEGEDDFRFALSDEEFLDLFLEDLELPDLAKRQVLGVEEEQLVRAGFKSSGPPAALSVTRTMRNSLSRRVALGRPKLAEIAALEAQIADLESKGDADGLEEARAELARSERKMRLVPFIDPIDVQFRRFEAVPKPVARAVMFCLMDVSGSMDEHMKDLAKRFYALLYLFLKRRYKRVDVVFIRHTHEAREVDEDTFFHSRESGGTVVSTALEEMSRIVHDRYPANQWNIYAAQASDGDNLPMDNQTTTALLRESILPLCQYYAYLEVGHARDEGGSGDATSLWRAYETVTGSVDHMAMRKVSHRRDIYPVFRDLFAAKTAAKAG